MSIEIPEQLCPFCKYKIDRTDGIETAQPKEGDISLCFRCMEISLFTKNLTLRVPTEVEIIEMQRSLTWDTIEKIRKAKRRMTL